MGKNIKVVNTVTQQVIELPNSNVTTAGELKAALREKGLELGPNDVLRERRSRVDYSDDNAILPDSITTSTGTTTDLLFSVTRQDKFKNGAASRAEIISKIKALGLTDRVKEVYGRPYTNVSTEYLGLVLEGHTSKEVMPAENDVTKQLNRIEAKIDRILRNVDPCYEYEEDKELETSSYLQGLTEEELALLED